MTLPTNDLHTVTNHYDSTRDDGMPVWMGPGRPPYPWEKP